MRDGHGGAGKQRAHVDDVALDDHAGGSGRCALQALILVGRHRGAGDHAHGQPIGRRQVLARVDRRVAKPVARAAAFAEHDDLAAFGEPLVRHVRGTPRVHADEAGVADRHRPLVVVGKRGLEAGDVRVGVHEHGVQIAFGQRAALLNDPLPR